MVTGKADPIRAFKALGDPTRSGLVELLLDGALPVHALAEPFRMSRPAISRHLRLLKEAGLVEEERSGRERLYSLRPEALDEIGSWAAEKNRRLAAGAAVAPRTGTEPGARKKPREVRPPQGGRAAVGRPPRGSGPSSASPEDRAAASTGPSVEGRRRPSASDDWQIW
jgi:DNA-binding transcriptional ArsR family regulator